MDDMSTVEALRLPPKVAEVAVQKARQAQMSVAEYVRELIEADLSTIEAFELPPEVAEVAVQKARQAQMSVAEYIRELIEADLSSASSPVSGPAAEVSGPEHGESFNDRLLEEHRKTLNSELTTDEVLSALHEGRPA